MADVVKVQAGGFLATIDAKWVANLLALVPGIVGYELRDAFGRMGGRWRKRWLGHLAGRPLQRLGRRSVFYRVFPENIRGATGQQRAASSVRSLGDLSAIQLEITSTSPITLAHEVGEVVRPKHQRYLAIPLIRNRAGKSKIGWPSALIERGEEPVRIGRVLYQKSAGPARQQLPGGLLKPAFILASSVTIKPTLGVTATWDELEADRTNLITGAVDNMVRSAVGLSKQPLPEVAA